MGDRVKPKLLILELWGMGDLVIATPFIRAAAENHSVTLLAKPFALEMRDRLWPRVDVLPFTAPWTAFQFGAKYGFWRWPWRDILRLRRELLSREFDCAVSGRWDPRDHFFMRAAGARERLGFPRLKSGRLLTRALPRPDPLAHRSEYWRVIGQALGLQLPQRGEMDCSFRRHSSVVLIHSGARLPARVWPLANYARIAVKLRAKNYTVQIACDPGQLDWWRQQGENASCPRNVGDLFALVDKAGVFIGNCSGPGHLAAISGVPTFTIYGPSLHEWWVPLHPEAEWVEGKACPYKPCADYCRYQTPKCLWDVSEAEVWQRLEKFVPRHLAERIEAEPLPISGSTK
jgi:heptosyltransferase-2